MSAKFVHILSDENRDLHKQTGCVNGFLQLFGRHHFIGGRRIAEKNHKSPQPDEDGDHHKEPRNESGKATGRNQKKSINENQRNSSESPRTSISTSPCSSSFSSLDYTKTPDPERSSFSQIYPPKIPTSDPMCQQNASSKLKPNLTDLRDVVKDSISREAHGLSVKASNKGVGGDHTLKYIDSPRPLQTQGSVTPISNLKDSFQVLAKLHQAPWNSKEGKDSSLNFTPRFSYDGKESQDAFRSTIKLKELPRLSLDSREGSLRRFNTTIKSNHLLQDLQRVNDYVTAVLNQHHEPGSGKPPSSVVARLMGLEALPDSMAIHGNQEVGTRRIDDDSFSRSSRKTDETNRQQISRSPRSSYGEAISPSFRNAETSKKHPASSKFPIEPAPRRQPDGSRDYRTTALKICDSPTKSPNLHSAYGKIEKRLADLEFKRSGKDLRALKQILEAMQKSKEMLKSRKEAQAPNFDSQTSNSNSSGDCSTANTKGQRSSSLNSTTIREATSPKSFKSPIVIMKPAKQVEKVSNPTTPVTPKISSANLYKLQRRDTADSRKVSTEMRPSSDLTPRTNLEDLSIRPLRHMDKNSGAKMVRKEANPITRVSTVSSKMMGTAILRTQQKKLQWEKQSHSITASSELNKSRRQPNRQPLESGPHNRKHRPSSPNLQQSESELSETSRCARDLIQQGDTNSLQSESNNSFISQAETEVPSTDVSNEIESPMLQKNSQKEEGQGAKSLEHSLIVQRAAPTSEQPSPVSVLDATFYDDMPSPIKKISSAFKDDEAPESEEEWSPKHGSHSSSSRISGLNNEFDLHQKAEHLKPLIRNFKLTCSDKDPNIDETASLYNTTHPDHKYILEILSASGLIDHPGSALATMQTYQSDGPINPNLFLALEHRRTKLFHSAPNAKIQRKLVFDVVNETLVNKLALENSSNEWPSAYKLRDKHQCQQLLVELCLEVDRLNAISSSCNSDDDDDSLRSILWPDLMRQPDNWTAPCQSEIPELVLDVERLIFKDLVSEVLNGKVLCLQGRPADYRRQLF